MNEPAFWSNAKSKDAVENSYMSLYLPTYSSSLKVDENPYLAAVCRQDNNFTTSESYLDLFLNALTLTFSLISLVLVINLSYQSQILVKRTTDDVVKSLVYDFLSLSAFNKQLVLRYLQECDA